MRWATFLVIAFAFIPTNDQLISNETKTSLLTFPEAFERAVACSSILASAEKEVLIKEALVREARLFPNPILELSADDLGSSSHDCEGNEFFLGISQLIELGGKRACRTSLAIANLMITEWDYRIAKSELHNILTHSFINTVLNQEQLKISQEQSSLFASCCECIAEKTEHGKLGIIEEKKANIACQRSRIELEKKKRDLQIEKNKTALLWGMPKADFEYLEYPFFDLRPLQSKEELLATLQCSIHWNRLIAELVKAHIEKKLVFSRRIPDIVFNAGVTAYQEYGGHPVSFGIEIPLPVFNRNQAAECKARWESSQAEDRFEFAKNELCQKLDMFIDQWEVHYEEYCTLKDTILPWATEAFEFANESYQQGKLEYLELLEAQKTYQEIRFKLLEALAECHHKKADIERLVYDR